MAVITSVTFEAIVGANTYNLNDGSICWLESSDGLGMAPMHRIVDRGPMQHGDSDLGYRLDPRTIRLVFGIDGVSNQDRYNKRATLLDLFRPRTSPIQLRWTFNDTGDVRQIDAFYSGDMTLPTQAGDGFHQSVGVSLVAHDPTFYDPEGKTLAFANQVGPGTFDVPTPIPTSIGSTTAAYTWSIQYAGTWLTCPALIRIGGPYNNVVVTNDTTGEKLDFTNINIPAGDAYLIDCRWGKKTVTNAAGGNKIADLSPDSDLATFHIAPDEEAPGGYNTISVSGDGTNNNTRVDVVYYNRYIGF